MEIPGIKLVCLQLLAHLKKIVYAHYVYLLTIPYCFKLKMMMMMMMMIIII